MRHHDREVCVHRCRSRGHQGCTRSCPYRRKSRPRLRMDVCMWSEVDRARKNISLSELRQTVSESRGRWIGSRLAKKEMSMAVPLLDLKAHHEPLHKEVM